MARAARKPAREAPEAVQASAAAYPLIGKTVRVLRGQHAGKVGRVVKPYRGSFINPDRVHIEEPGGALGWYVSVNVSDVEVMR